MIEVLFQEDRETGVLSMELRGHAGFAEAGRDPVCAGASVLAMTLAQCAKAMEEAGRLRKKAHVIVRGGRVLVTVKPRETFCDEARHLFWVGETGLRLLAEAYPGYIEIQSGDQKRDPLRGAPSAASGPPSPCAGKAERRFE